jgi:hypothetical protein
MDNCKATEFGEIDIGKVRMTVATDDGGTQILLKGENLHLISQDFETHVAACETAKRIEEDGIFSLNWESADNAFFNRFVFRMAAGGMNGYREMESCL